MHILRGKIGCTLCSHSQMTMTMTMLYLMTVFYVMTMLYVMTMTMLCDD